MNLLFYGSFLAIFLTNFSALAMINTRASSSSSSGSPLPIPLISGLVRSVEGNYDLRMVYNRMDYAQGLHWMKKCCSLTPIGENVDGFKGLVEKVINKKCSDYSQTEKNTVAFQMHSVNVQISNLKINMERPDGADLTNIENPFDDAAFRLRRLHDDQSTTMDTKVLIEKSCVDLHTALCLMKYGFETDGKRAFSSRSKLIWYKFNAVLPTPSTSGLLKEFTVFWRNTDNLQKIYSKIDYAFALEWMQKCCGLTTEGENVDGFVGLVGKVVDKTCNCNRTQRDFVTSEGYIGIFNTEIDSFNAGKKNNGQPSSINLPYFLDLAAESLHHMHDDQYTPMDTKVLIEKVCVDLHTAWCLMK